MYFNIFIFISLRNSTYILNFSVNFQTLLSIMELYIVHNVRGILRIRNVFKNTLNHFVASIRTAMLFRYKGRQVTSQ